jgi:hypothetical protein
MKRMIATLAVVLASLTIVRADDRPVTFAQLPQPAQTFINNNYSGDKVSFATVDDDFFKPDYNVVLVSGVKLQFENDGRLESIKTKNGNIPAGVVPVQITDAVKAHYPDAKILEYEIGRRTYEVKLSNRLELKFDSRFNIIEIDD